MPARTQSWGRIERAARSNGHARIVGVDEVGRGPLAGPVVACAVVMPPDRRAIAGVDDSKRLDPDTRLRLAARIREEALAVALGAASAREVDARNIARATVLAMQRALARLTRELHPRAGEGPHHVLVDGLPLRTLGVPHTAVVQGDAKCYAIACASIVAKVTRDRLMTALDARHQGYGWARNSGYGTAQHREAVAALGLTPHHRRSFCLKVQGDLLDDLA
jgi:ribonuclease HII